MGSTCPLAKGAELRQRLVLRGRGEREVGQVGAPAALCGFRLELAVRIGRRGHHGTGVVGV